MKANYHQLDIESAESIQKLAAYLKQTYGGLDVLVNNAAVAKIVSLAHLALNGRLGLMLMVNAF